MDMSTNNIMKSSVVSIHKTEFIQTTLSLVNAFWIDGQLTFCLPSSQSFFRLFSRPYTTLLGAFWLLPDFDFVTPLSRV